LVSLAGKFFWKKNAKKACKPPAKLVNYSPKCVPFYFSRLLRCYSICGETLMIRATFDARRLVWTFGMVIACGLAFAVVMPAQQAEQTKTSQAGAQASTESNQGRRKTIRRLPAYYTRVVNQKQREQIYDVQAKYQPEIDALEEQLQALIAKRDAEIEAVLTPEQRETLAKFKADAAAQRSSAKQASTEEAAPTQDAQPAATPAAPTRASAKKPARSTGN
jgi:hypothetical protein